MQLSAKFEKNWVQTTSIIFFQKMVQMLGDPGINLLEITTHPPQVSRCPPTSLFPTGLTRVHGKTKDCVTIEDRLRYGSRTKDTGRRSQRFTFLG